MNNLAQSNQNVLKWAHRIGIWEGISYLLLLFIAMPIKYGMGYSQAVRITGTVHGFLFVVFFILLYYGYHIKALSFKTVVRSFILSIIPFGTFYLSFDKSVN